MESLHNKTTLELCDLWQKLEEEWSPETKDFVNELYSRLEHAETDNCVFRMRLKGEWTKGSTLYTQEDVDRMLCKE